MPAGSEKKSNSLIEIESIEWEYPDEGKTANEFQLKIEHLSFPRGKMTAVLGRSGSGKSTMLDIIGMILPYTNEQTVRVNYYFADEKKVWTWEELLQDELTLARIKREKIGYMFQESYFLPSLPVTDNILLTSIIKGVKKKFERNLSSQNSTTIDKKHNEKGENDEFFNLTNWILDVDTEHIQGHEYSEKLSGGQNQRLSLFRSVLHSPQLLFLDEPTGNLDYDNSRKVFTYLRKWAERDNRTIILVTHNHDLACEFADVIYKFDKKDHVHTVPPEYRFLRIEGNKWQLLENDKKIYTTEEVKQYLEKKEVINIPEKALNWQILPTDDIEKSKKKRKIDFEWFYLKNDYWPPLNKAKKAIAFNKILFLLIFLVNFLVLGFLNGFLRRMDAELNDPYAKSIPVEVGTASIDPAEMIKKFPQFKFYPYQATTALAYHSSRATYVEDFYGLVAPSQHPFWTVIRSGKYASEKFSAYNRNHFNGEDYYGIVLQEDILTKLGLPLNEDKKDLMIKFKDIGLGEIEDSVKVLAVCRRLPEQFYFIIYEEFADQIINGYFQDQSRTRKEWYYHIQPNDKNYEQYLILLDNFFKEKQIDAEVAKESESQGLIYVKFSQSINNARMQVITDSLNKILANSSLGPLSFKKISREPVEINKKFITEWRSFSINVEGLDKKTIEKGIKKLEKEYPGIHVNTKAIFDVFLFNLLQTALNRSAIISLLFLIVLGSLLNYKVVTHHLYRIKRQLGYLKTLGLSLQFFRSLYLKEGLIDVSVSILLTFLLMGLIQFLIDDPQIFIFKIDDKAICFFLLMTVLTVAINFLVVDKLLSRNPRELMREF